MSRTSSSPSSRQARTSIQPPRFGVIRPVTSADAAFRSGCAAIWPFQITSSFVTSTLDWSRACYRNAEQLGAPRSRRALPSRGAGPRATHWWERPANLQTSEKRLAAAPGAAPASLTQSERGYRHRRGAEQKPEHCAQSTLLRPPRSPRAPGGPAQQGRVSVRVAVAPRRERSDVDDLSHRVVPGVVRVEVIPRQLRELAVRQVRRFHVTGDRVERGHVELHHAVEHSARVADELVEDLPTRLGHGTVVPGGKGNAVDTER